MDAHDPVANTVAQRSHQENLLDSEDCQRGPLVTTEREIADQQAQPPVNTDRQDPPARTRYGPRAGFGQAEPLSRIP